MKATADPRLLHESERGSFDFEVVYRTHYRDVVRWVRALGGPDMEAEDLAQDVFVVVNRKLATFDGRNLRGWLYTIAGNLVSDRRRGAWFRHIFSRPRSVLLERVRDLAQDPQRALERKEAQRLFYALAHAIHPSRREAFLLFEVGGLSGAEIAVLQGTPVATTWTRLHLARKEFLTAIAARREEVSS